MLTWRRSFQSINLHADDRSGMDTIRKAKSSGWECLVGEDRD